jgi:inactive STAND
MGLIEMVMETVQQKCLRLKQESIAKDLARLEKDLLAVENDLDIVQEGVKRRRLQEQKKQILSDLDDLAIVQEEFEKSTQSSSWKRNLYKINHTEPKEKTSEILRGFQTTPGSSLFFFQQSQDFLCIRYIEYLINLIDSDDIDIGHYSRPYQIGFSDSSPRPIDFLKNFAEHLDIKNLSSLLSEEILTDLIIDKIKTILSSCNIFFIQINLLKLGQHHSFITWFLDVFWCRLTAQIPQDAICLGVLTLESSIKKELLKDYLGDSSIFDQARCVVLPNKEWEKNDIQPWMTKYSGHRTILPDKLENLIENILEYQKGIPSRAEEQLERELSDLDNLKRLAG